MVSHSANSSLSNTARPEYLFALLSFAFPISVVDPTMIGTRKDISSILVRNRVLNIQNKNLKRENSNKEVITQWIRNCHSCPNKST